MNSEWARLGSLLLYINWGYWLVFRWQMGWSGGPEMSSLKSEWRDLAPSARVPPCSSSALWSQTSCSCNTVDNLHGLAAQNVVCRPAVQTAASESLLGNAEFLAKLQTFWISQLFNKIPRWFMCSLKFKKHWPIGQNLVSLRSLRSSFMWHSPYVSSINGLHFAPGL